MERFRYTGKLTPVQSVETPDGRINVQELHKRFSLVDPWHVGRRAAVQIVGHDNLRSLDKKERKTLGRQVATLIRDFGWEDLAIFTMQLAIETEHSINRAH